MYPHCTFPLAGASPSEKRPIAEKRFFLLAILCASKVVKNFVIVLLILLIACGGKRPDTTRIYTKEAWTSLIHSIQGSGKPIGK